MIRGLLTGIAACALMTGAAFAQPAGYYDSDGYFHYYHHERVYHDYDYDNHDAGGHALRGGVAGAGAGAVIGCIVTIPIGCAPGAAIGAAVGGGTGAVAGAASTPEPRDYDRDDY